MFWNSTPRELSIYFKAFAKRRQNETDRSMHQAWHIAAFPLMKKFPALADVIGEKQAPRKQSWQDQLAIAKQWSAVT